MFGHQDTSDNPVGANDTVADATLAPETPSAPPIVDTVVPPTTPHDPEAATTPAPVDDTAGDYIMTDQHGTAAPHVDTPAGASAPAAPVADDGLLSLKQQALQQLTPLVGHLDQTPEERFRTTMMMIQAADNRALLQDAYQAAQAIPDEKVRAQALLDVVNEINYFTQPHDQAAA